MGKNTFWHVCAGEMGKTRPPNDLCCKTYENVCDISSTPIFLFQLLYVWLDAGETTHACIILKSHKLGWISDSVKSVPSGFKSILLCSDGCYCSACVCLCDQIRSSNMCSEFTTTGLEGKHNRTGSLFWDWCALSCFSYQACCYEFIALACWRSMKNFYHLK